MQNKIFKKSSSLAKIFPRQQKTLSFKGYQQRRFYEKAAFQGNKSRKMMFLEKKRILKKNLKKKLT